MLHPVYKVEGGWRDMRTFTITVNPPQKRNSVAAVYEETTYDRTILAPFPVPFEVHSKIKL